MSAIISDFFKIIENGIKGIFEHLATDFYRLGVLASKNDVLKTFFFDTAKFILKNLNTLITIFMGFVAVMLAPYIRKITGEV